MLLTLYTYVFGVLSYDARYLPLLEYPHFHKALLRLSLSQKYILPDLLYRIVLIQPCAYDCFPTIAIISYTGWNAIKFVQSRGGYKFSIFAIDKIKPLDDSLKEILENYSKIVVIEDNFNSGLYNSLCQFISEKRIDQNQLYSISVPENFGETTGDTAFLDDRFGLSPTKISIFLENLDKSI